MSRMTFLAALVGLSLQLFLGPGSARAQTHVEFTPFFGGAIFTANLAEAFPFADDEWTQNLENSFVLGGAVGIRYNRIGVEGSVSYVPTSLSSISTRPLTSGPAASRIAFVSEQDLLLYNANASFYFAQSPLLEWYLSGGAGQIRYSTADPLGGWADGETNLAFNVGLGTHLVLKSTLSMRVELRDYISMFDPGLGPEGETTQQDFMFTFGLSFRRPFER